MANNQPAPWDNWEENPLPWLHSTHGFMELNQHREVEMFRKQDWINVERQKRREAFKEEMLRLGREFDKKETAILTQIVMPHAHRVWYEGVEETRKRTIPAYTFERFGELPLELQLRIWSMAARLEEPSIHTFSTLEDEDFDIVSFETSEIRGSSRIDIDAEHFPEKGVPSILHVCRYSRMEGQKIYTPLCFMDEPGVLPERKIYFNTLYDMFYIGGETWSQFKMLIDIVIKLNTTRPLRKFVQQDLAAFQNIRFLAVDFLIFAALPIALWAEFPKVEKFTIVMYPTSDFEENPVHDGRIPKLKPAKEGTTWRKRADWVRNHAKTSFSSASDSVSPWQPQEIEVLYRKGFNEVDDEEDFDSDGEEDIDGIEPSDGPEWYEKAAQKANHVVSVAKIKELKHAFHPSRKVGHKSGRRLRCQFRGKRTGDWITDSEAEADKYRPFLYHDED